MDQTEWAVLLHRAGRGNVKAQYDVAIYFDQGFNSAGEVIVVKDQAEAFRWLKLAHQNGSTDATVRLADYFCGGISCNKDEAEAVRLYNKAIAAGHARAAVNLAIVYRDRGDLETAFNMYQVAQRLANIDLIQVAFCYHFGVGVKRNQVKAFESFSRIADDPGNIQQEEDINESNYQLGLYYLQGDVVTRSIETAGKLFEKACRNNNHAAAGKMLLMIGKPELPVKI